MIRIKAYNYRGDIGDEMEVDENDIMSIVVQIVTGDECIFIVHKDGDVDFIDGDTYGRDMDFNDGRYVVHPDNKDELERWNNRKDSYDYH